MRTALATHVLRGYPPSFEGDATPDERRNLYAWLRRRGFDGVEVGAWWFDFYNKPLADVARLKAELADFGLALAGLNCLRKCVTHPAVAEAHRRDLRRAVEVAKAVGIPVVSISLSLAGSVVGIPEDRVRGTRTSPGASRNATDEEFGQAAEFLAELAREAAPAGVELALELHHCSLADTSRSLLRLLDLASQPNISANPDLGNLLWAYDVPEDPWHEAVERLAGKVKFWHVKNVQRVHFPEVGRAAFVHAALPDGDIDYRWALGRFVAAGFDGWLSLEGAGAGDWLAFAARGKAYLDELRADLAEGIGLVVQ